MMKIKRIHNHYTETLVYGTTDNHVVLKIDLYFSARSRHMAINLRKHSKSNSLPVILIVYYDMAFKVILRKK